GRRGGDRSRSDSLELTAAADGDRILSAGSLSDHATQRGSPGSDRARVGELRDPIYGLELHQFGGPQIQIQTGRAGSGLEPGPAARPTIHPFGRASMSST